MFEGYCMLQHISNQWKLSERKWPLSHCVSKALYLSQIMISCSPTLLTRFTFGGTIRLTVRLSAASFGSLSLWFWTLIIMGISSRHAGREQRAIFARLWLRIPDKIEHHVLSKRLIRQHAWFTLGFQYVAQITHCQPRMIKIFFDW